MGQHSFYAKQQILKCFFWQNGGFCKCCTKTKWSERLCEKMLDFGVVENCEFSTLLQNGGFSTLWRIGGFFVKKLRISLGRKVSCWQTGISASIYLLFSPPILHPEKCCKITITIIIMKKYFSFGYWTAADTRVIRLNKLFAIMCSDVVLWQINEIKPSNTYT